MVFVRDDSGTWWTIGILAVLGVGGYLLYNEIKKGKLDVSSISNFIINLFKGKGTPTPTPSPGGNGDGNGTPSPSPTPTPTPTPSPTGTTTAAFTGDIGSGRNDTWKKVFAEIGKKKPSMIGIAGDFSYSDAAGFKPVTDLAKTITDKVFGAMGNHDSSAYAGQFTAFSNSVQNVGNISIMLLDTDDGAASVTFAKANLSKMTNKWKIVMFHKPIFVSPNSNHSADEGKIKALVPEFEKAGVQLVVQAHVHALERFAPKNNVTYVLVGGGGESHYKFTGKATDSVFQNDSSFGFLYITCTATTLTGQFISDSGQVLDSFTVGTTAARAYYVDYVVEMI